MKNVRKIIAVLVVLCVLVTAQICTLAEDANAGISDEGAVVSQEADLVSKLKTAWVNMYEGEVFGSFDSNSKIMNQNNAVSDLLAPSQMGITFNADGTFDKATYEGANFGGMYYLYGMTFNKDVNGVKNLFTSNINSIDNNSFNAALNNDSLNFTFNPGTVTAAGNIRVYLQYNGYGNANVFYSTIDITADDSNKDKKIVLKDLTYKCADSNTYSVDWTLTKLSDALKHPQNNNDLVAIKIFFNLGFVAEGASISSLQCRQNATLPDDHGDFGIIEWYNAAANLDISGYENTEDFVAARTALYDYLYENNLDFIVSELKDSWSKLSKDETVAAFDENSKIMNQNNAVSSFEEPSSMGITFNNDGTFNKAQHDNYFNGNYELYGMTFNVNVDEENKPFTSGIDSFNNAFSNDSLYFTFNPGTVTKDAEIWVLLQYNGYGNANVLCSQIQITTADSGKDIKVVIKDLTYKCRNVSGYDNTKFAKLSDALKNPVNDLNTDLCAIKIFFHHDLAFTGASISGLKYTNSETVPADTDGEIVTGKALRVDDEYYGEIANTFVKRREYLYNIIKGESELGDVNGVGGVDICDLVRLCRLCSGVSADGYDSENEYKLLGDMDANGYVDAIDIIELRKTLFNMY